MPGYWLLHHQYEGTEGSTRNGGYFALRADARNDKSRMFGQCEGAHAATCPLRRGLHPCAMHDVFEPLVWQKHIRSSPSTSHPQNVHRQPLGSTEDCTRAFSYGLCRDLFHSNSIIAVHLTVIQIPAACTTRSPLSPCASLLRWDAKFRNNRSRTSCDGCSQVDLLSPEF